MDLSSANQMAGVEQLSYAVSSQFDFTNLVLNGSDEKRVANAVILFCQQPLTRMEPEFCLL